MYVKYIEGLYGNIDIRLFRPLCYVRHVTYPGKRSFAGGPDFVRFYVVRQCSLEPELFEWRLYTFPKGPKYLYSSM